MRALVFAAALWIAGTPAVVAAQTAAPQAATDPNEAIAAKARQFIWQLVRGEYGAAAASFDATMAGLLPEPKLRDFWTGLAAQSGAFERYEGQRVQRRGAYDVVVMRVVFAKAQADVTVAYDSAGRIAGFNVLPAAQPAAPPPYVTPSAFSERNVTVGWGEWALPATLAVPSGPGPFPAVVIVHGSGPGDRDGTLGPNKPYRDLAQGLASRGIAVLRYDKRTRVHGGKMMAAGSLTVKEETVDDAALAVALLAATPSIAPDRIFVLGHSLGAMLVPRIAAAAPAARGFIVLAGPARPLEQALYEQAQYIAGIDGTTTPQEQALIDQMKGIFDAVRALKPSDIASKTLVAGIAPAYWLDLRGYDPPEAAKAVTKPMLVLQGERDYQVTPAEFARWQAALGSRSDVVLKIYPGLNHSFIHGTGPANPQDSMIPGHVALQVVEDIAAWVLRAG